jgi:hypothetical protein
VLTIQRIGESFARVCALAPAAGREALIREVYLRVHCRIPRGGIGGGWSERGSVAAVLDRAATALSDHRVEHRGFVSAAFGPDGRSVLVDAAGIKVFAPPGVHPDPPTDTGSGRPPVVRAPILGLAQEGRWLIWSASLDPAPPGLARLYLNLAPDRTFDGWLALVLAVADAGLAAHVKCVTSLTSSARADCVIAYAPSPELPRLRELVRTAVREDWLDPETAGFAWPAGPGVGAFVPAPAEPASVSSGYAWATRLVDAHRANRTHAELRALDRALSSTADVVREAA